MRANKGCYFPIIVGIEKRIENIKTRINPDSIKYIEKLMKSNIVDNPS